MDALLRQILLIALICFLCVMDIILTTRNKREMQRVRPDKKPEDYEANQLVVYLWKKIGDKKTALIFLILAPIIWITGLMLIFFFKRDMVDISNGFIIGCYFIINYLHLENINILKKWEEEKNVTTTSEKSIS